MPAAAPRKGRESDPGGGQLVITLPPLDGGGMASGVGSADDRLARPESVRQLRDPARLLMPLDPKKIESVMQAKGVSRADLARLTGIAPPHITRMLSGGHKVTLATAERVAAALKTTLAKLLT